MSSGWERRLEKQQVGLIDERQSPRTRRSGSNGTLDLMTPMFQHRSYKADAEMALGVLRERELLDETDPARPYVLKDCRVCREPQRMPLFTEDGRVVVSPFVVRMLGMLICDACDELEQERLADTRAANDFEQRLARSGLSAAMVRDLAGGWDDIIVRGKTADDGARRVLVRDYAREWAEASESDRRRGLWLWGPAGAGKTRLLATAALARLRVVQVRWVSVAVLITQLDGAWSDADRQAGLKVLTDPGVVVLDDLDKIVPTSRVQMALFTALEAREQAGVGILVSSNGPPSEIGRTFSSPFMSRLVKLASPMQYPGPDLRLQMVS